MEIMEIMGTTIVLFFVSENALVTNNINDSRDLSLRKPGSDVCIVCRYSERLRRKLEKLISTSSTIAMFVTAH